MTTRSARPRQPLVEEYLAQLDRELASAGAPAADRAEIVAATTEHIDAALERCGPDPSADTVRGILADLGSPAAVAEGGGYVPTALGSGVASSRPEVSAVAVTSLVCGLLGLLSPFLLFLGVPLGIAAIACAVVALRRHLHPRWAAAAGLVLGIVTLLLQAVIWAGLIAWTGGGAEPAVRVTSDVAPIPTSSPSGPATTAPVR